MLRHTMIDTFKAATFAAFGALAAYFEPIERFLQVVALLYFANLIVAIVTDKLKNSSPPSIKKFWNSIKELTWYLFLIFLIFTVSERMDFEDGAIYVIKAVMALVIYFYSVNILKNATILSPQNRFVKVLYMLMTIDFLEKFAPWAKKYINE